MTLFDRQGLLLVSAKTQKSSSCEGTPLLDGDSIQTRVATANTSCSKVDILSGQLCLQCPANLLKLRVRLTVSILITQRLS